MRSKFFSSIMVLSCLVLTGLMVMLTRPAEPSYNGRKLGDWLAQLDPTNSPERRQQGVIAIREIGTNALPLLIKLLQTDSSGIAGKLRDVRRYQLVLDYTPNSIYRWRAVHGFRALGAEARPAIPQLAVLLYDESTCACAMFALVAIGPDAVPALEGALSSTNEYVRSNAAWGLTRMRSRA